MGAADKAVRKADAGGRRPDAEASPRPRCSKSRPWAGAAVVSLPSLRRAPDGKAEALFHDSTVPWRDAAGCRPAEGARRGDCRLIPKVMTGYQLADGWSTCSSCARRMAWSRCTGRGGAGVGRWVTAGATTQGHRFEAAVDLVRMPDADSYAATLETEGAVIAPSPSARPGSIRQLAAAAEAGRRWSPSRTRPCSTR